MIAVGSVLLWLPFSTAPGERTGFLTALFTATTSVCVTGLVVVETAAHWSLFGKIVILVLIQLGGIGIISVSSAAIFALRRRMSLNDRVLLMQSFNLSRLSGLTHFLRRVLRGVFSIELIGAVLYSIAFIPRYGALNGVWYAVFTSISAFCNAGIDILGADSLMSFSSDPLVLVTTMLLIVTGGLGYAVWFDIWEKVKLAIEKKRSLVFAVHRLNEHSKLVLALSVILLFGGAVLELIFEFSNPATLGEMSFGNKILNALFQSVTFRTAGFAAISQKALTEPSVLLGCVLMFIGGSPVGTAGGVKTVTLYIVLKNTVSYILNRHDTVIFNRKVPSRLIREATAIALVSLMVAIVFTALLMLTNGTTLNDSAYEVISAICTVGLSRDLTPSLNTFGRLLIIVSMYLGRIGPISLALFFRTRSEAKNVVRDADGKFIVG
ncbi:MAG: potassium transporter TrkH [Oscillospiraceae bacterium]|nr:potassium transporter TrkH [Oscillospiraceae bacterium]